MIVEEANKGLDREGMVEMRELLRGLGQGERTVLLSSHLLAEVEQICQRVGVIQKGRLVAEGTLDELRGQAGLVIRAEPAGRAREVLVGLLGENAVDGQDGAFRLRTDPGRAGDLNTRLVQAGGSGSELRASERLLVEGFLQLPREDGAGWGARRAHSVVH